MPTLKDESLRAPDSRTPGAVHQQGRGNFAESVIWAPFCDNAAGQWDEPQASLETAVEILLFLSDTPAISLVWEDYQGAIVAPAAHNYVHFLSNVPLVSDLSASVMLTPTKNNVRVGEQTTGTTTTNNLAVSGYYHLWQTIDRGIEIGAGAIDPYAWLFCVAQAPCIHGQHWHYGDAGEGIEGYQQILLIESAYTAAIQQNNNEVVSGTQRLKVVGIYGEYTPA